MQAQLTFPKRVGQAMSHRGDPMASHLNADALNKSGAISRQARMVLWAIASLHQRGRLPATAAQIASMTGLDYYKIQRRLCDLERAGKIRREKEAVKCQITGRPAHRIELAGGA